MKKYSFLSFVLILTIVACSCNNNPKGWVQKLETCYGTIKTMDEADKLSDDQALDIAKCLIEHCHDFEIKIENMSDKKQEKFLEKLEIAINSSDYKELLLDLDCEQIQSFIEEHEQ